METGGYTAKFEPSKLIMCNTQEILVGHHSYSSGIHFPSLLSRLLQETSKLTKKFTIPSLPCEEFDITSANKLTVTGMLSSLSAMLDERYCVVTDVGDCLYAGLSLKTDLFIAPGYYSSMGFGVPAGIGAQIADKISTPL